MQDRAIEVEATLGAERRVLPDEPPTFEEGEELVLKGWPFYISRVNASSLVLRPELPDGVSSARRLIDKMKRRAVTEE